MLSAALLFLLPLAAFAGSITADPPPGWALSDKAPEGDVVLALKGPETSAFVLTKLKPLSLDNRAVVRALLVDVLAAYNAKSGQKFIPSSQIRSVSYDNGLTAQVLRADLDGKPRLALALTDYGGQPMLATLTSAVPDMMLPSILGGLKADGAVQARPGAGSLDEQLAFSLPPGLAARALSERERKLGFVLAVDGLDSELMVMKLVDEGTPIQEQPQILKGTVASMPDADPATVGETSLLRTPAGPDLIYASARAQSDAKIQLAAGYLQWGYVGYSILAKGPRAAELIVETFKTVSLGSSALPKVVAETPRIPVSRPVRPARAAAYAGGALLALAAVFLAWKRRRPL